MGDVTRFPRGEEQDARARFPLRLYPMSVAVRYMDGREVSDPTPQPGWSETECLRWMLAMVRELSGVDVELRRTARTRRFFLRLGDRPPIVDLSHDAVWYMLGGAYELSASVQGANA
jgi:hypothetical protein